MDAIAETEQRLRRALEKLETRVESLRAPDGAEDENEVARLSRLLDDEKEAMSQLDARYQRLRRRHSIQARRYEAEKEAAFERAEAAEESAARLLAANERLREAAEALRASIAEDAVDPARINRLMREEIAALKEARAADREALDGLVERLTPFVGGVEAKESA